MDLSSSRLKDCRNRITDRGHLFPLWYENRKKDQTIRIPAQPESC